MTNHDDCKQKIVNKQKQNRTYQNGSSFLKRQYVLIRDSNIKSSITIGIELFCVLSIVPHKLNMKMGTITDRRDSFVSSYFALCRLDDHFYESNHPL